MRTAATRVFLALTAVVVVFQIALALGAPWGEYTMGGAFPGVLPPRMRLVALMSALLLTAFGAIVAARAALAFPRLQRHARWLIWIVVVYSIAGVALNALTPSSGERALWLPVAIVLALCAGVVARTPR